MEVWQAREKDTRQLVVARLFDASRVDAARRDARALERIDHPNVVRYVADGAEGDGWCVVTEYVDGASLAKVLRVTSPSPPRAIGWMRQVCAALAACHGAGVVHADLHPGNVVMSRDAVGRDKLVLLGFERSALPERATGDRPVVADVGGSDTGFLPTTAPERIAGRPIDPRADQYGVGALLYRLLVERYPFSEEELRAGKVHDPPALGHHAPGLRLPPGLEEIVFRCLSRLPEARFASMDELGSRLASVEYLPQRDWVRATGLDLTIAPSDKEPPVGNGSFLPGAASRLALAAVAAGSLIGAMWLAMSGP